MLRSAVCSFATVWLWCWLMLVDDQAMLPKGLPSCARSSRATSWSRSRWYDSCFVDQTMRRSKRRWRVKWMITYVKSVRIFSAIQCLAWFSCCCAGKYGKTGKPWETTPLQISAAWLSKIVGRSSQEVRIWSSPAEPSWADGISSRLKWWG